jgi:outer membrane protein OmpA-like peptidoglycan-associated protein
LRTIKHKNLAQARINLGQAIEDGARTYAPVEFKMAMEKYKNVVAYIEDHRHDAAQIKLQAIAVNESARDLLQTTHDIAEATKKNSSEELIASGRKLEDRIEVQQSAVARDREVVADKLEQARRLFTRKEAEIERMGNTLVIRLKGLKFPTSKAVLNDSNLRLLGKLQRFVKEFANNKVEIEGHTDSIGSEINNSKLSKERAQTVKDYLLSADAVPASRINVIGRGEEAPISSNNTSEGRAQNRRADILIHI